MRCGALQAGR